MGIIPETWSYSAAQSSTELLGSLSVSAEDAESSTKASSRQSFAFFPLHTRLRSLEFLVLVALIIFRDTSTETIIHHCE
ncbi:hypothetical protein NC651_022245 [Populus alba x Populus x berolinensis]|nr:hypothetical protein NC651_022245 [Populus alba x Populus x berolinensis]